MDANTYEVILTDTAKEELENIYEYIAKKLLEVRTANKLIDKIEQSILMLEENPYSCKEVKIKPHNDIYRKLVIENYILLYSVEEKYKQVVVYRIVYGKTDYLKIEE